MGLSSHTVADGAARPLWSQWSFNNFSCTSYPHESVLYMLWRVQHTVQSILHVNIPILIVQFYSMWRRNCEYCAISYAAPGSVYMFSVLILHIIVTGLPDFGRILCSVKQYETYSSAGDSRLKIQSTARFRCCRKVRAWCWRKFTVEAPDINKSAHLSLSTVSAYCWRLLTLYKKFVSSSTWLQFFFIIIIKNKIEGNHQACFKCFTE